MNQQETLWSVEMLRIRGFYASRATPGGPEPYSPVEPSPVGIAGELLKASGELMWALKPMSNCFIAWPKKVKHHRLPMQERTPYQRFRLSYLDPSSFHQRRELPMPLRMHEAKVKPKYLPN